MLDLTKPVQTRDGRAVRIYVTDGEGDQPVVGAVTSEECSNPRAWNADGTYFADRSLSSWDLLNVPEKHKRTVWVWKHANGTFCFDRSPIEADSTCFTNFAKVEIEFTEGQGL